MEVTYKDDELLKINSGSQYIHDSTISRFDIYEHEYQLCIDVYFISIKGGKQLKIHFTGIIRYQFSYSNNYNFYTVESYKFFKSKEGYYISLAPFNELDEISEEDEDLILCEHIEGFFI